MIEGNDAVRFDVNYRAVPPSVTRHFGERDPLLTVAIGKGVKVPGANFAGRACFEKCSFSLIWPDIAAFRNQDQSIFKRDRGLLGQTLMLGRELMRRFRQHRPNDRWH